MSAKGVPAVLEKLELSIKSGDYYHAQQMYKTLYFRYASKKQYGTLRVMLVKGACLMLEHGQLNSGIELAQLLLEHFEQTKTEPEAKVISLLLTIFARVPKINESIIKTFVVACVNWSSRPTNNNQGSPELHNAFAQFFWKLKDYAQAEKHFLRGSEPQEYAKFLVEWSESDPSKDSDTYVADAVFQYLCLTNLKDANIVYDQFIQATKVDTNLTTFLRYLLLTLKRDAYPLLKTLKERYAATLNRDPDYLKYLQLITKEFYGVEPPQGFGGLLGNLLKGFM
eukprot:TRINITY_DN9998_c0_g1_i1.p1 TRINITY_DN9998_c0_g1~~TRINITY_DN9998_c0_g1_i1.p1  ORF type:complete len:282 (+),score=43.45 TRINITY_DN9998_c0_g1_i1:16-861(+)